MIDIDIEDLPAKLHYGVQFILCLLLGVEDLEAQSLYATVAPNPASDRAVVSFFNPTQGQVQLELYTLQGQLLQRYTAELSEGSQQFELALHDITTGFYFLRIKHDGGWGQTMKLVVD